jgi:hypothetical protein
MKYKKAWFLLLWLISPAVLLLEGLRETNPKLKKYALVLFVTAFGTTIVLSAGDGSRHAMNVGSVYSTMPFNTFLTVFFDTLFFRETEVDVGAKDVFLHTLSYIAGLLNFPRAIHIIVSFIYGYCFIGSMMIFLKNYSKTPKSVFFLFLVFMLVFTKNLEGIQSIRNWTACWVSIYGFLKYTDTKNKKYLLLIAVSPFIHFSYLIISLPLVILIVFKIRPLIYFIIFILSTFTSILEPEAVKSIGTNPFFEKQVNAYYNDADISETEKYNEKTDSGTSFHRAFVTSNLHRIPTTIITGLMFLVLGLRNQNSENKTAKYIFFAGVLMLSLSNFFWFLSSLSNRTLIISMILILAGVGLFYQSNFKKIRESLVFNITLFINLILYLPYLFYSLSILSMFTSICMLFFPPFVLFFPEENMSLKSLLNG